MSDDIDEILASGAYVDRRGRAWFLDAVFNDWVRRPLTSVSHSITPSQMRRLIVREQHRNECPGLIGCFTDHPVPVVLVSRMVDGLWFEATHDNEMDTQVHTDLAEAMDAAARMGDEP